MADNDEMEVNDEYQFAEMDPLNPNVMEEETQESGSSDENEAFAQKRALGENENNVKRNAIIAVIAFVVLMFAYKFIGSYLFSSKDTISEIKPAITEPVPAPIQPASNVEPTPPIPAPSLNVTTSEPSAEMKSNLSSLVLGQENLNSQISTFSGQIDNLNSNVDALNAKISDLERLITNLSSKLDSQAQIIERMSAKPAKAVVRHTERPVKHIVRYYIQAVIPGRAWLVDDNGNTLTVREGSHIPGYGRVRLIDPNQGRVMTSSGMIIRFSQSDS